MLRSTIGVISSIGFFIFYVFLALGKSFFSIALKIVYSRKSMRTRIRLSFARHMTPALLRTLGFE